MILKHKEKITLRHSCILIVVALALFSNCENAFSQPSNSTPWPTNPGVGIGTKLSSPYVPENALHIHHDPTYSSLTEEPILRLSEGSTTTTTDFGILGLMVHSDTTYSSLSSGDDLILHEHLDGDIIITNCSTPPLAFAHGTAIRFATTGDTTLRPTSALGHHDLERMTIFGNGNVGIDLPPSSTGLDSVKDQLQIGGGVTPYPGNTYLSPGLTIYGGNRFENMLRPTTLGTGLFPGDWRYISFNHWIDHNDNTSSRSHRFQPIASSGISFSENNGGLLDFTCSPYDSILGLNDFSKATTMELTGNSGLATWFMDTTANPYHHLFDIFLPGQIPWPLTRNTNGLTFFHTPVCITSDTGGAPLVDFQNLPIKPDIGDGLTWMLVVKGAELAKEVFVLDSTWADYVFDPGYKLPPLCEVESYVKANHHLPDIEPANKMAKTGVPIGRTEEALTKNVEELTLYVIEQNKKIEKLEADMQELINQKEK